MFESITTAALKLMVRPYHLPLIQPATAASSQHVVVLAPHIDDETIGCGGTLHQHVRRGDHVTVIFLTDGRRSANALPDIVARREAEGVQAVQHTLGVTDLRFWRYPDRELGAASDLAARVEAAFQELGPDILYVTCPWDPHPDHVAAARAAAAAASHVHRTIRLCESFCPLTPLLLNACVDISDAYALKAEAMRAFTTQVVSFRSILLLNRAQSAAAHRHGVHAVEAFIEVDPARYPHVVDVMVNSPIRPYHMTQVRNLARAYLTNLTRARRLARGLMT